MNEDSQLDLTSEPFPSSADESRAVHGQPKPINQRSPTMRIFFNCCRVYAVVHVPAGVLNGRLSSWRFHCPRCGNLVDIPLDG